MCEHSSVNSAAALREIRRRKILENSANRLKLIEGINCEKTSTETFLQRKPNPPVHKSDNILTENSSSDLNSKFTDFINTNKELKEVSDFLLKDHRKICIDEAEEEEEEEEEEVIEAEIVEGKERYAFLKIFLQKRLHYVFLALTVNILFFCDAGNIFYENIFCPFYTLKAIELISKERVKNDFQPVLFLFVAGLPKSVQKFTKIILPVMLTLFSDLCIYLFAFIIGTKIMNSQN